MEAKPPSTQGFHIAYTPSPRNGVHGHLDILSKLPIDSSLMLVWHETAALLGRTLIAQGSQHWPPCYLA